MYQNSHRSLHRAFRHAHLLLASLFTLLVDVTPSWSNSLVDQAAPARTELTTLLDHGEPSTQQNTQQLVAMLRSHNVDVRETPDRIVVTLPTTFFAFSAIELTNTARIQIRHIATALHSYTPERLVHIARAFSESEALQCQQALDNQGTEKVAFALEAAGISRQQLRIQQERYPTPSFVQCCPVQDATPPSILEEFRIEIHIAR